MKKFLKKAAQNVEARNLKNSSVYSGCPEQVQKEEAPVAVPAVVEAVQAAAISILL